MNGPNSIGGALLASAALCVALPGAARAQCRLCESPTTSAVTVHDEATALRLEVITKLDFDRLILLGEGRGSALVSAKGVTRASGSVAAVSGRAVVGELLIRGEPGRTVRLELPTSIVLFGMRGGTIRIDSLDHDLGSGPTLDSNGELRVRLGGEIQISGDVDGDFRGDIPVFVDYL